MNSPLDWHSFYDENGHGCDDSSDDYDYYDDSDHDGNDINEDYDDNACLGADTFPVFRPSLLLRERVSLYLGRNSFYGGYNVRFIVGHNMMMILKMSYTRTMMMMAMMMMMMMMMINSVWVRKIRE